MLSSPIIVNKLSRPSFRDGSFDEVWKKKRKKEKENPRYHLNRTGFNIDSTLDRQPSPSTIESFRVPGQNSCLTELDVYQWFFGIKSPLKIDPLSTPLQSEFDK